MRTALTLALLAWAGPASRAFAQSGAPPGSSPAPRPALHKEALLWAPADIKWAEVPDAKGIQQAVLWGDPATRGYGALKRWPAGLELPLHWHTFDIKVVVLSGTLAVTVEGGATRELPAGSYAMVPGRSRHASACRAGADCVFFSEQNLRYDIKMVEAPPR